MEKKSQPTVCPDCAASCRDGRWSWGAGPPDAPRERCPACQRIRDGRPAGTVTLVGDFVAGREQEVIGLVRSVEERERKEHPLKRIMDVEVHEGRIEVTTTDTHLARAIGEAMQHRCHGELDLHYAADESVVHVHWRR